MFIYEHMNAVATEARRESRKDPLGLVLQLVVSTLRTKAWSTAGAAAVFPSEPALQSICLVFFNDSQSLVLMEFRMTF